MAIKAFKLMRSRQSPFGGIFHEDTDFGHCGCIEHWKCVSSLFGATSVREDEEFT